MVVEVKVISIDEYQVTINGTAIESFDKNCEAVALKEQLLILGEDLIKEIYPDLI